MIVYRLTSKIHARDLSGTGAMLFGGRWNNKGQRMLYTSASIALATLEVIANLSSAKINLNMYLVEIEVPDSMGIDTINELPDGWNGFPHSYKTVELGSSFLKEKRNPCLCVPSAIVPYEYNFLFNPLHDEFEALAIKDTRPFMIDQRLAK